jgi:hypothetical protein
MISTRSTALLFSALAFFCFSLHSSAALIDLSPAAYRAGHTATTSVESEGEKVEKVEASYQQKGHLLALVPVSYEVKVVAHADGRIELDYPWYAPLTVSRRKELEMRLKVAVDTARRTKFLGSVKAQGEAVKPEFSKAEAEAIAKEMERVLSGE